MSITSFLIYCIIATFTPGPTNIVILSTVHNWGTKKAMQYTYGASVAFGLLLVIFATLNTMFVTIIPKIIIIMQIIGSLYMLYLAFQIFKTDTSKPTVNQTGTFMSGFLMQFLNPKVVLFTMTVIPSFIMPYYTSMPAVLISVVVITLIGFLAFITWVLFGTIFKEFLQKHKRIVNVVMALLLAYSGIMIWL
ncbi:LysE family translocator [Peribacillus loiseleuriae]|uniref:Lysine transporter LysE n=1 Tax=Peribacillus loiseleuriae TaxID=1679170 RepID=A0A0K9GXK5_9BACI|nr:LysE family transporter [Peribacillus loiseleuriae]KMY51434.1 lysine transporter LysE [Peribacillus loiseleuriae]